MSKIPKINYKDVYNQVTGEYFPKLIHSATAHFLQFPYEFNFVFENSWKNPSPRDVLQLRDVYELELTTKWKTRFINKLTKWHLKGYPIMFNYCEGLKFGKIINVNPTDQIQIAPSKCKPSHSNEEWFLHGVRVKTVPLLEVVELTPLEYCEILETTRK